MLTWTVRRAWCGVFILASASLFRMLACCWVGLAYLSAVCDASKVSVDSNVRAKALPVIESARPKVVIELLDDVAPPLFLLGHDFLVPVGPIAARCL